MEDLYQKFLETSGINTDSRTPQENSLYVAIKGENFDGNTFVEKALENGARYVITTRTDFPDDPRVISVTDTVKTLQELALYHREKFSVPIIAIGGSNGKTTTKELIAEILSRKFDVLKTEGNLNNYLGVSKTLLRMKPENQIAVIEIGANHLQEHSDLLQLVKPTHMLVTNNGLDHLEGFGSIENVRKANAEFFEYARNKARGVMVFVDSSQEDLVEDSKDLERILYNLSSVAISQKTQYAGFTYKGVEFTSNLAGSFNAINMLAAIVVGEKFAVTLSKMQSAIAEYRPTLLRSEVADYKGATWIVDCYNANPSSMKLAIENISMNSEYFHKGLILGGMREMGNFSDSEHQKLIDLAKSSGAEMLVFVGNEFSTCTLPKDAHWFANSTEAKQYFDSLNLEGFLVLLKGSRGIKMEIIIGR